LRSLSTFQSQTPEPSETKEQSSIPQEAIYGIVAAVVIVVMVVVMLMLRKRGKGKS
jgi:hypothetical protein